MNGDDNHPLTCECRGCLWARAHRDFDQAARELGEFRHKAEEDGVPLKDYPDEMNSLEAAFDRAYALLVEAESLR